MLTALALSLTITAAPQPLADPLRMSSRDLMNQQKIELNQGKKIEGSCTDSFGNAYDSKSPQYSLCLKNLDEQKSKRQALTPTTTDPNQTGRSASKSIKLQF